MSFKEFLEDLKFEGEKPATKRAFWLAWTVALVALSLAIGIKKDTNALRREQLKNVGLQTDLKTLAREQLKNQYMLAALCNMPENQLACVAGLSDFEHDKD